MAQETQTGALYQPRGVGWGGDGREVQTGGDICIPDFPCGSDGKASAYNAGDLGSIPGSGRSPGEGNDNPFQYSYLENPWTEETGGLQSKGLQKSQT